MNLEREREAFEAWAYSNKWNIFKVSFANDDVEKYADDFVEGAWHGWLASVSRDGYKLAPIEPTEDQWAGLARHLGRYMQTHDRYCPKTLKKYFDRFIGEPPEWLTKEVGNWESDHAFATADFPVFIYKAMMGAVDE